MHIFKEKKFSKENIISVLSSDLVIPNFIPDYLWYKNNISNDINVALSNNFEIFSDPISYFFDNKTKQENSSGSN